jgi:hypothetical protein
MFRALAGASFVAKALVNATAALAGGRPAARARAQLYGRMAWLCARGDGAAERLRAAGHVGMEMP